MDGVLELPPTLSVAGKLFSQWTIMNAGNTYNIGAHRLTPKITGGSPMSRML
jgi:hypothetical protein